MTKPARDLNQRWLGLLLAALVAALVTLLGAGTASAAAVTAAQTCVGAHTLVAQVVVGTHDGIDAGQGVVGNSPPADDSALVAGIAVVNPGPAAPRSAFAYNYDGAAPSYDGSARLADECTVVRVEAVGHHATAVSLERQSRAGSRRPVAISGFGVAAITAPRAIAASTRVAPWAGSSLSRLTTREEVMYRVWGGEVGRAGSWISPIRPASSAAAREGLALPGENAATFVSQVRVPAGTRMQVGTAGRAFGEQGGWTQAQLLDNIPLQNFGKGAPLP